jgi:hypothetical protein
MKQGRTYGSREYEVARMPRRAGSTPAIRRRRSPDSFRTTFHACAPRKNVSQKGRCESKPARTQKEGQAFGLGPRFPRQGLVDRFCFFHLACEFRISQPLADDLTQADVEPLGIGHLAIVEPESLFIDVAEQVKRLYADVGAVQLPLHQTPEVFHAVSVDIAIRVFDGVIDDLMFEAILQAIVGPQFVGKDRNACFDVFVNVLLKFLLAPTVYNHRSDVSATFQHAHHNGLILAASSGDDTRTLALVHVSRLTADESLVDFNTVTVSAELATLLALLSESDPMEHEPSGFLSDAECPRDLTGANSVFAIENEPHCREPPVQTEWGVLEDGADLNGELPFRMARTALPAQLVFEKADCLGTAGWTYDAVFPFRPTCHEIIQAVLLIREIQDRFLQAFRLSDGFHTSSVRQNPGLVKYIFAQNSYCCTRQFDMAGCAAVP